MSDKKSYSLLMPPPNLTGELHMGHAMQHSILDAVARFKRMQGFEVLLLPGVDHAGIQFEGTLNKLLEKEGLNKNKLGKEAWLKRAWQFKDEIYKTFHDSWKVFGLSANWEKEVFTLDISVQKSVFEQFKRFWEQDLLYKGAYLVSWCSKCGTAIEDVEMEYEERKDKLYFVKYPLAGTSGKETITVATVRPETIYADVAIAVSPDDPRYKTFIGREARKPLSQDKNPAGNRVPIIADARVNKEFGTGALKITPGHDPLDYTIGKDHKLPILHAVNKSGRMTELAGDLADLKVAEARVKAVEKLEKLGALDKVEDYIHSVPICERCKTAVEPLISEEWFVKMKPLADKALGKIDEINFLPKTFLVDITNWLENIHDWSISRSLWWGHPIPVWYCSICNPSHLVGKYRDMVISLDEPDKTCQKCSEKHWVQDEQVLDTWFSSGLWPLSTLGWPAEIKDLEMYYPWDFEITGGDIKYMWIARMIMLGIWHTDQIPFKNMFFHGMIRDLQGRRFSKSLGNGINPNDLRETWGTDATRMALYTYCAPGRDGRASRQTIDARCKSFRNFSTKLTNITLFVVDLKPDNQTSDIRHQTSDNDDDQLILDQLNQTIKDVTRDLDNFNLHLATEKLYDFIWHQFADIYLEKSKLRREETQPILEQVLKTSLELLYPFMPFITEELWQKLPHDEKSILTAPWPTSR